MSCRALPKEGPATGFAAARWPRNVAPQRRDQSCDSYGRCSPLHLLFILECPLPAEP
jgi:hypothetical protein